MGDGNNKPAQNSSKNGKHTKRKKGAKSIGSLNGSTIYRIKILHPNTTGYCVNDLETELEQGDYVVVPTRYGLDLGKILGVANSISESAYKDILIVEKKVDKTEFESYEKNGEREDEAYRICLEKIREYSLDMKLVSAHYLFGEQKILFFFTADSRIDFRDLVRDLVSVFRTRIELRQIGVRDESRVIGGLGVCGRGYCCHSLTDKLNPVSIKMAKKQNLSLNSLKISGPCGRLLCCLAYEYDYYKEVKDKLPSEGSKIHFEGENCRVIEINVLSRKIKLGCKEGRVIELPLERLQFVEKEKKWQINSTPAL